MLASNLPMLVVGALTRPIHALTLDKILAIPGLGVYTVSVLVEAPHFVHKET
jgi:hypothetical protein